MSVSLNFFDTARCRARIAGMRDDELDDYIARLKARLADSHRESYFLEESLLIQLGEASEELRRRQKRVDSSSRKGRKQPSTAHAEQAAACD